MKNIIITVLVLIVLVAGYFWLSGGKTGDSPSPSPSVSVSVSPSANVSPSQSSTVSPTASPKPGAYKASDLSWKFNAKGEDSNTHAPKTEVVLVTPKGSYTIGTYTGSCSEVSANTAWKLLTGEVEGVICYFAGGGTEVGVFNEGAKQVVKVGDVEEGSAESAGFRGNFKTVLEL